jgi:lipopolysaccharide/colanic/teichoic acid biosynthesis glycosyltransferase
LCVSLAALVLLAPLMLAVALAIKIGSPGPVFYRGTRTGRYGRPFGMLKFRTMVVNAEQLGGSTTGLDDPRVTRLGNILRALKLDELPQLLNVIRGDMSLVGPRPEVQEYTSLFTEEEKRILTVRPGITDLASLRFHDLQKHVGHAEPDRVFRERILPQKNALRLQYVDQQCFLGDLAILLRTAGLVLRRLIGDRGYGNG